MNTAEQYYKRHSYVFTLINFCIGINFHRLIFLDFFYPLFASLGRTSSRNNLILNEMFSCGPGCDTNVPWMFSVGLVAKFWSIASTTETPTVLEMITSKHMSTKKYDLQITQKITEKKVVQNVQHHESMVSMKVSAILTRFWHMFPFYTP